MKKDLQKGNTSIVVVIVLILVAGLLYVFMSKDSTKDGVMMGIENDANPAMMQNENAPIPVTEGENDSMATEADVSVDAGINTNTNTTVETGTVMVKAGSYEAYNVSKLANAADGDVVLFFRASWCPSCINLDKDIKANSASIKSGLTILDVDYDKSQELKKKYGVTYQHTLVQVDKDGNMIKKWSGSRTLASLTAEIK